jgi:hypothetical protein
MATIDHGHHRQPSAESEFVSETILSSTTAMAPVREAFEASYSSGESGKNQFTKVRIGLEAHRVLASYFGEKIEEIEETWFNVLSPAKGKISELKRELGTLAKKLQPQ